MKWFSGIIGGLSIAFGLALIGLGALLLVYGYASASARTVAQSAPFLISGAIDIVGGIGAIRWAGFTIPRLRIGSYLRDLILARNLVGNFKR